MCIYSISRAWLSLRDLSVWCLFHRLVSSTAGFDWDVLLWVVIAVLSCWVLICSLWQWFSRELQAWGGGIEEAVNEPYLLFFQEMNLLSSLQIAKVRHFIPSSWDELFSRERHLSPPSWRKPRWCSPVCGALLLDGIDPLFSLFLGNTALVQNSTAELLCCKYWLCFPANSTPNASSFSPLLVASGALLLFEGRVWVGQAGPLLQGMVWPSHHLITGIWKTFVWLSLLDLSRRNCMPHFPRRVGAGFPAL